MSWTYGMELELADWDTLKPLPRGFQRSPDRTIVNSNGVAAQPNIKVYRYGGEINTPPTSDPVGQVRCLFDMLTKYPESKVNYRSNLHVHIRVPGLRENLKLLKSIQEYIHLELPSVINLLEPIPRGVEPAAHKRELRRRVSHHTFLTPKRLDHQLSAKTVQEFFEREVPRSRLGKPMWHAQPRLAVGLRQLLQTDTIEFRHFPGTLNGDETLVAVEWCRDFLDWAIAGKPVEGLWKVYSTKRLSQFPEFEYETEVKYQATASGNGLTQGQVKENISLILEGKFHGSTAESEATQRACGLSREHLPESVSR